MSSNTDLAIANTLLAVSSGWSFLQCQDLKFVSIGFAMSFILGVLGLIDYVVSNNSRVKQLFFGSQRTCRVAYTSLIAAEAIVKSGHAENPYAYAHLLFPVVFLVLTEAMNKRLNREYLDFAVMANSASIIYSSYLLNDIYGGVCGFLNFVTFSGTRYSSMQSTVIYAITNISVVQFFNHVFFK